MATELFPPKERTVAAVSHEFLWALGGAILPGWAYVFRKWRYLQIAVSLPTILGLLLIWSVKDNVLMQVLLKCRYKQKRRKDKRKRNSVNCGLQK
jgi:hypothetical protein